MNPRFGVGLVMTVLVLTAACSQGNQQKARDRAAEAQRKARAEAHRLAHEAKTAAHSLDNQIHQAMNGNQPGSAAPDASEKLRDGGQDLRAAGNQAGVKLDHAAMIAKLKARLASAVGFSTVTSIEVQESAGIVTLRGTAASPDQKSQAEQAVRQVPGVTRVVNDLQVKP
jgi:osmotically-inducible protein OsmY